MMRNLLFTILLLFGEGPTEAYINIQDRFHISAGQVERAICEILSPEDPVRFPIKYEVTQDKQVSPGTYTPQVVLTGEIASCNPVQEM